MFISWRRFARRGIPIFSLGLSMTSVALAQTAAPVRPVDTLDPTSPMAPMPDIGVAWPTMDVATDAAQGAAKPMAPGDVIGERRYSVTIEGIERLNASPVLDRFNTLSVLRQGEGKSANISQIDRRTREDLGLLESILRTSGYYDAQVESSVENDTGEALIVRFVVTPGPLYRFNSVVVQGLDDTGAKAPAFGATFGVAAEDAVDADDIVGGRADLEQSMKQSGFPFAKVSEPEIVIDHESRTGTLAMTVESGGERRFGQIRIKSVKPPFDALHVSHIARFKSGQPYDQMKMDDLRRALVATGLVGTVDLAPVPGLAPGSADIEVGLEKAPVRTVAGEIGYGTGEGFRLEASWTHRNFFRPEGALTFRGVVGTREQLAGAVFRQSNYRTRDHVLGARLLARKINQPAYDARTLELGFSLDRQSTIIWQKRWTWGVGSEFIASDERDIKTGVLSRRQTFLIAALPLSLNYDGSNDLLDPTKGIRAGFRISPELSLHGVKTTYVRAQFDTSGYYPVSPRIVMAARVRLGSVFGELTQQLAPSRRFYAGGGGSVRGFGYQAIGPRDAFNQPVGGRSLVELSAEARIRFGDFGLVPFVDAGNIYDQRLPKLSGFRYGAGLGLRYHSNFGPIRIDVGTPINPQQGDTPITVFVSLGQAF